MFARTLSAGRRPRVRRRRSPRCWQSERLEPRLLLSATAAETLLLPGLAVDDSAWDHSRLLIRVDPQTDPGAAELANLHTWAGGNRAHTFAVLDGLQVIHLAPGVSVVDALAAYRAHPAVDYAEPNYRVHLQALPDDPQFGSLWGLDNSGQTGGTPDADIDAPEAWGIATGSGSVVVAVIDTGVDHTHPDLAANMWINAGEVPGDGIDNDGNGYADDVHGYDFHNRDGDPRDDHNHGTHVAGTIGAVGDNGLGVTGINWSVQIMALKFLGADGSGTTADAIEAINYAVANGARISNNSWGSDEPFSQALHDAVAAARDAGHVFVAAAGNGNVFGFGQNNDTTPFWPANFDLDNVVSVAAVDHDDQRAIFSNYGATSVDLAAPGVNILSTTRNGTYGSFSGTSMATPHVTGVLALLLDRHPEWSPQELIARVLETVDPVADLAGLTVTGGRLNAFSALVADVPGPRVIAHSPSVTSFPVSGLRVRFSRAVDAGTFTPADVLSFSGPDGPLAISTIQPVAESDGREFDIVFAEQSAFGTYELVLGPDILDLDGDPLNQDADETPGEPLEDRYTAVFVIEPFSELFDFGTATSPVEPGAVAIDPDDTYGPAAGFGWLSGSVLSANRSSGTALTRDLNFSGDATFAVDVPDGQYDITLTTGDTGGFAHDQMAYFIEGIHLATLSTAAGQVVTSTYSVSVSDGQLTLRLADLGGGDPNAVINGLEVRATGPDVTGARVVATDPAGGVSGTVDRIVLDFSEAILEGSFTLEDVVSLAGPEGPIAPTSVEPLTPTRYEVVFAPQQALGEYTLVVGPGILDPALNPLDQDGDGANGEPADDRFTLTFAIQPFSALFDFGTSSSPVEPGYVRITPADAYSAVTGFGWRSGSVLATNRTSGTALTRDLNFSADMTFAVNAAAAGLYDVTLIMGDTGGFAHDQMGVFLEGAQADTVSTAAGQIVTRTYRTSVSDGELTLRLADLGGADPNAVINGLEVRFVGIDTAGPRVIASDPTGNVVGSVDRIALTFDEPLRDGTFTLADVLSLAGPNGAIPPLAVNRLAGTHYEIVFARQFATGDYSLTIGPDIEDLAGNLLDQDQDGTGGETPDDQFAAGFTLESFEVRFDFGTASSPVAADYVRITPGTAYGTQSGYGWLAGSVLAVDRTSGTALTRDLNFTELATFAVEVPNGTYHVTVTMGDTGPFGHDQMGVFLEGVLADTVSTAPRQVVTRTYEIQVGDGQFTLGLDDLGGSDRNVVINGLELQLLNGTGVSVTAITEIPELSSDASASDTRTAQTLNNAVAHFPRASFESLTTLESGRRDRQTSVPPILVAPANHTSSSAPTIAGPRVWIPSTEPASAANRDAPAISRIDLPALDEVFRSPQFIELVGLSSEIR